MKEKKLVNGEWEITVFQLGFVKTFKSLEEGRAEVAKLFKGGK